MAVAALGRPFTLGMLYDCRRDELIPGFTLWNRTTLQNFTAQSSQQSSEFEIITSDSTESKSSLLDVDASLKASFMGGLIEVGGSAKYLNDRKKSHTQSRVTFQYKATTTFKQLSLADLGTVTPQQIDVIEKSLATHVVTGILYGANAFFVFDSEKVDASEVQNIQGSMQAVIKKIPSFSIEGSAAIKLTEEEKALTDKFSCKFYGDFLLDINPTTFEDAVRTYQQLPKLLGENNQHVVPLKVWMMPLKVLNVEAAELVNRISVGLARKAHDALEDLHHLEIECNDYLDDKVVKSFPMMHKRLSSFQSLCVSFRSGLQQILAKKVPSIRAGDEDEKELEKILDRHKSPFHQKKLTKWLEDKEREINVIRSCVEMMEGMKIVPNQSGLDREVLAPAVEEVFCFVFTSLENTEPYLQELEDYMDLLKATADGEVKAAEQNPWYFSDEVITRIREKVQMFKSFAKTQKNNSKMSFLVAAIANGKHKGASIYHYKNAILVSDDFSNPGVTDVKEITLREQLMLYACALTLDPNSVNERLVLSEGNKRATNRGKQSYPDHPDRFDHYPQVLCKEGLTGRCYWEVEWSTAKVEDVAAAISYRGLPRKTKMDWTVFGRNSVSWSLGNKFYRSSPTFYAEYNDVSQFYPLPVSGCSKLGVFLDWPAGTLSYYNVSGDTLTHLHTFRTKFTEPVYPGFKIWRENNYVFLPL
ncbi:hypothetical protein Q5P01_023110 [Channa striata]|uniref:B30.2/SPRY domain-containing protein n=1 Tax=Channa striata TaxID=64152 RepID=A0AA88ISM5_CHASR|nr:hypothetical protein Q5P01_023110 [Channa striata]